MSSPNHNAPWTPRELRRLRALARSKMSARLAARELGRSTGAVKFKAMVEGIRFRFINQPQGVQSRPAQRTRLSRITAARHRARR